MPRWFFPLLFLASCSFSPGQLQVQEARDLPARNIQRIAVLRLEPPPDWGGQAPGGARTERDPGAVVSHVVYVAMVGLPNWYVIAEREVGEAEAKLPPARSGDLSRARAVGAALFADAVLIGRVLRYRERVGEEFGARSPASVAFVLQLLDVRSGDLVWSAEFNETQKPLSENVLAIGDYAQRGIRWLRAEELAQAGARRAVERLHAALFRSRA
jgi:hypothetical protein